MGSGLCSGVFELLVVMKGGHTRLLILDALAHQPKNKLQLAAQLAIDWKAIDRHMKKLLEYSLVEAYITVGTCTLFIITEKGKHALTLAGQYYRLDSIY
jgi:predicted ArsR family transcriptional regulator